MDGQQVGVRTAAIDEKCQAFETLVIYCSTLGPQFSPYLSQSLELVLPSLRFYLHDGVREACAMYVISASYILRAYGALTACTRILPMLLACGKQSNTLSNQMVSAAFAQLAACISTETDASFLASLYKCVADCVRVLGGPGALPGEYHGPLVDATTRQLQALAEKRKARGVRTPAEIEDEREDLALLEEMEDFALEDMARVLVLLDPGHPLLVAVSSVKDLGLKLGGWDSEDDGAEEGR